jgi:hypothetical protein
MKMSGRVILISCAVLLCACDAVEISDEELQEETAEPDVAIPDSLAVADGVGEARGEEVEASTDGLEIRVPLSFDSCHTFDFLVGRSMDYCEHYGFPITGLWHFTYNCTGWWGAGARKVWFSCFSG